MSQFTLPQNKGPRAPLPFEPGPIAEPHEGRAFLIAILVSLIVHGLIVLVVYNKVLDFGGNGWNDQPQEFHVQRATRDMITDQPLMGPPAAEESSTGVGPGAASGAGNDKSLATTSQGLLGSAESPAGGQSAPLVGGDDWRRASEVRPGPVGGTTSDAAPRVDLPDNLLAQLPPGPKLALQYKGEGKGTGAIGGSTATGQAQEMLSGMTPGSGLGGGSGAGSGVGQGDANGGVGHLGLTDRPGGSGGGGAGTGLGGGKLPAQLPDELERPAAIPGNKLVEPQHLDDDFDYNVTVFDDQKTEPYSRVDITPKRTLRKLRTIPRDVVVVIDISGSIPQAWVNAVVRGVRDGISALNNGDRFNIVFFNEKPSFFSRDGVQPLNDQNIAAAGNFLMGARSGGDTDVNQALGRLMVRDVATSRVYDLILISDGVPTRGVMNTRELINLVTRDNDLAASIYCVGVGKPQNRPLLEFLAYRNRGFCVFCDPDNSFTAPDTIRDLMSRLRYPIMKDIRMTVAGLDNDQVFPRDVPNIHQGETLSIFGRYATPSAFTMRLAGHNGQQPLDFTFTRNLKDAQPGDKQLAHDWAFWKLHHLYSEVIRQGETPELREAIDKLRKEYGLKTLY